MAFDSKRIDDISHKIELLQRQKRAEQRRQREEQRKTDSRRFYIVGELVVNYFPELKEIKPGTKTQNVENFSGFIKFLETISADGKIADCFRDCMHGKPENNGNV